MRWINKIMSLCLLLPGLLIGAYAIEGNLRISYEALKVSINLYNQNDYAEYILFIKNLGNQTITIIPDIKPYTAWTAVFEPTTLEIGPNEEKNMTVKIYAKGSEPFPNQAIISFYAYGKEYSIYLPVETYGIRIKELPKLHIDYWSDPYVYPGQDLKVTIDYKNEGNISVKVYVEIYSKAFEDKKYDLVFLSPGQDLYKVYHLKVKENAAPGYYEIYLKFDIDGKINKKTLRFQVLESPANIDLRIEGNKIIIKNHEDKYVVYSFEIEVPKLKAVFFKPNIEPTKIFYKNNSFVYHWDLVLAPREEIVLEFKLRTDLIGIILLPLAVALILFLGHLFLGYRVSISKSIVKFDRKNRKIKVALYVMNKSKRTLKEVTVKDLIPPPFALTEEYEFYEPSLINVTDEGTEVIWVLRDLLPGEERVITYTITYRSEPTGTFELPPAKIVKDGKVVTFSFPVFLHFAK